MPAASTAPSSDQVLVGANGTVYVAAVGTTAPTDEGTALNAGFKELGYLSEEGVSIRDSKDVSEVKAWQNPYPVRRLVTGRVFEVTFALEQWNWATLPFALGGGSVLRPVQLITLTSWDGTDSFKITWQGTESIAFVRGTNGTAAAIQAALRTLTGDTGLTVSGTTDSGPFTVTFSVTSKSTPLTVTSGTGGTTGAVTSQNNKWGFTPPDGDDLDERAMVVQWNDGTRDYRLYMPRGIVTEQVETNIQRTEAATFPVVFSAIYDGTNPIYSLFTDDTAFEFTP